MERIRFEPVQDWRELRRLRSSLGAVFSHLPEPVRDALIIAANELVENGLLHGDPAAERAAELGMEPSRSPGPRAAVTLELLLGDDVVELSVTTPLRSTERARLVLGLVEEVVSAPDPHGAYVERLLELARSDANTTSKLGFHRIALEGGCSLQAVHANDYLTVCARRALP